MEQDRGPGTIELITVFGLLNTLLRAECDLVEWFAAVATLVAMLLSLGRAHFLHDIVVQIATFAQFTANIQVALFFPSFDDANAELAVRISV